LIEPWDLSGFKTVVEDGDGYIDEYNGDKFEDDEEILDAVKHDVASGFYGKLEYEWKKFLKEFDQWYNSLKKERE